MTEWFCLIDTIVVATTARLELRQFSQADAEGFCLLNSDPLVMQYTGDHAFADIADAAGFIRDYQQYNLYGFGRWSLYLIDTQEYIGFCGLSRQNALAEVDLGFRIARRHWRQGYASEAAQAAILLAQKRYGLRRLIGRAEADNVASISTLKKLGFDTDSNATDNPLWRYFSLDLNDNLTLVDRSIV